jgi:chromate reductase, NAD(P)H dehydrogenase (quinone)
MERDLKIVGIAGSLRRGSYNKGLMRAAIELAPGGLRIEEHRLDGIPFYDADLEAQGLPGEVQRIKDSIEAADGVLIATPEYNYSVPAVLKNVLDWAARPKNVLSEKPIALMGASVGPFGTTRAQLHLRQIFTYTESLVLPKPHLYIMKAEPLFDAEGNLTDEATRERIAGMLEAFRAWIVRLNPPTAAI